MVTNQIKVSIAVPAEAEPSVVVGLYDAFWAVGVLWNRIMGEPERPRFNPELIGMTLDPIATSTGIRIAPHRTFAERAAADIVIIPTLLIGSGREFGRKNPAVIDWVRQAHEAGSQIVSACTGSFLLAEAGLLDNRDATTHWAFVDLMKSEYPSIRVHPDRVLVSATGDGRIVTAGGAASWIDLVLYLAGKFAGPKETMQLAKIQMFDWHHNGQTPYLRLTTRPQTGDRLIHDCQEWLADHYAGADPVKEMIRQSGLSRRTFGRRFQSATGHAPLEYVQRVRIEEAKQLLETGDRTIEHVAAEVGYSDAVSFRRLFKRMVGETPAAYRRRLSVSDTARALLRQPLHSEQAGPPILA
ncbi:MAG: helix-turn-helix domain-containing protein [Rhizobiales bacterium]|nr:helix-turn-helix domain-containing protein [Hyphomicrobiales bacterium]